MKKLVLACLILLLALVSCSPKQKNKDISTKKPITTIGNEQNTSIKSERHNLTEITEKGAKVVLKDFGAYGTALVTYNEDDIWVDIYDLLKMKAVVTLQNDNKIIDLDYCQYYNCDTIKVYKECNKESESFFVTKKYLLFHRIQGIKDWLYLTSDYQESDNFEYKELGFVYVYDISEKSYYGNIEEDKKSNNYFTNLYASEYETIQRYKNIKRYGPLLTINHNNKTVEFWDSFIGIYETDNIKYSLLDYYPDYNEILICTRLYEGTTTDIFNLESRDYSAYGFPYFNNSRTNMISVERGVWGIELRIYAINNGSYNMLKEIEFNRQEIRDTEVENIVWLNDNKAQINFDNSNSMLVEIGKEVKITGKP